MGTIALGILVALVLILIVAFLVWRLRRPAPVTLPPPAPIEAPSPDRRQELAERGTELIQRRVDLDARRGTLGGDTQIDQALSRLEDRRQRNEISEEEFEAEKIRLLGG